MAKRVVQALEGQHGATLVTLSEICQCCGVHAELILEMVEYGVLEPVRGDGHRWLFAVDALPRFQRAQRLRRDLQIDLPGLALSLDLLDEIDALRRQVESLRQQLQQAQGCGQEARIDFDR